MPIYEFFCPECGSSQEHIMKVTERPATVPCPDCQIGLAEYHVGKPAHFRVKFDQGGRIGYKYDMGGGKTNYRSATKELYEHTIGSRSTADLKAMGSDKAKSVYTKEYGRHVEKQEKAKMDKLKKAVKGEL